MDDDFEPKFWNKKTKSVEVDNVELSKRQTTLDSILGTYHWIYYSYANDDGDIEKDFGYISLAKSNLNAKATPAKIIGSLQLHIHTGTFKSATRVKEGPTTRKYRKNFWAVDEIDWDGDGDMGQEGNGFGVCEVEDDNGNPFLKFETGDKEYYGCHGDAEFGFYLGKKVDDTPSGHLECELTEDEQIRLGLVLSKEEVKELATKGYISDSSDEDSAKIESDEERGIKRKRVTGVEKGNKKVRKA